MELTHFESLYPADSREKEIAQIVKYIRQGTSCQLIGLPGVGKGNVLGLLAYNRAVRKKQFGDYQVWIHFVSMNFSEVRAREMGDVMKFLFLSLADSLRDRNMDEAYAKVTELFRSSLAIRDELVLVQGLKEAIEYLCLEKKLTVVFLFGRFEEYLPSLTPEFFTQLRALRDRAKFRFSVVFSVSRPLEDNVEESLITDFYDYLADHHVYVGLFDEVSIKFRLEYLQKLTGRNLPKGLIGEVFRLTGMHERLLRMSFEALLQRIPHPNPLPKGEGIDTKNFLLPVGEGEDEGDKIDRFHLIHFLLQQKPIQKALSQIEKVLTPQELKLLGTKHFTKQLPIDSLLYLEQSGLVKDEEIAIPLFAQYLVEKRKSEIYTANKFSYDKTTNTIKRGAEIISEMLTAAEFRLLSYLMQHPDQTIDREELIKAVWQEQKTTLGVTDQALDQLIFRLRKKIEEDPNDPKHVQTVKGRGFKFSP